MKTVRLLFVVFSMVVASAADVRAQSTAFTYQGRLMNGESAANGSYDFQFRIYDALTADAAVAGPLTVAPVPVSNGVFTVTLDFGGGVFNGAPRWLHIGVRTNGSSDPHLLLEPRQPITATPHAIFSAAAGAVSNGLIQDPIFLGTTALTPLEFFAGNQRALRLEPNSSGAPNVIAGSSVNHVDAGIVGSAIAGGGAANYFGQAYSNRIASDFSTIGGGWGNYILSDASGSVIAGGGGHLIESGAFNSAILGGFANTIRPNAGTSTIGGGYWNEIGPDVSAAVIGGGLRNTNLSSLAGIASGFANLIQPNAGLSFIGGGQENTVEQNAGMSVIGGGWLNRIHQGADQSVIAGGNAGKIYNGSRNSFIGGGFANTIGTNAPESFVGGGVGNDLGPGARYSIIGGGLENSIGTNARQSFIGGGVANRILDGTFQAGIMAGVGNSMSNSGAFSVIAGGAGNHMGNNVSYSTIAGGRENTVRPFSHWGTIGGGEGNAILPVSEYATITGGRSNTVASYGFVGGGDVNVNRGFISVIGGGRQNQIGNQADFSVIAGGGDNEMVGARNFPFYGVIGGGQSNRMQTNAIYSVIGGGFNHTILTNAQYATIPGGASNAAGGRLSFAAGNRAKAMHDGTFVWADSQNSDFTSGAANQFLIRATGGVGIGTNNPTAPLEVAGTIRGGSFITTGTISGNGSGMSNVNAATLSGQASANFWQLGGNNVAPGQFLGSTNNQSLEFKVNGMRAMRIEFGGDSRDSGSLPDGAPNMIGGAPNNLVPPGVVGATIAGGGATNHSFSALPQTVAADFGFIGGGYDNTIESNAVNAVISGGRHNRISTNSYATTIGGGTDNTIAGGAFVATIAGGGANRIERAGINGAIGGGSLNLVDASGSSIGGGASNTNQAPVSAIGGGVLNQILGGTSATIGGGSQNTIEPFGWYSTIGGGSDNRLLSQYAGIFSGHNNLIEGFCNFSLIGGGAINRINLGAHYATVVGGSNNAAYGLFSAIGGGVQNEAIGHGAVVPGGERNQANGDRSFAGGYRAKAIQNGTFVWADSTDADFFSGRSNQFVIRASNGVGIGTGNPSARLHVYAETTSTGDNTALFQAPNLGPNLSHIHHGTLGDWYIRSANNSGKVVIQDAGGRVGIGTSNPQQPLHLNVTSGEGMRIDSAIAGHNPAIYLNHTGAGGRNYRIASYGDNASDGSFRIRDDTAGTDRLSIDANGQVNVPGNLSFGSQIRQMVNLWSTGYGIGVQSSTLYHRTDLNFAWYRNGVHNDNVLNPGGGTEMMRLTPTELRVNGAFVSASDRNVKAGFQPVDPKAILEKVAALPITRWHYTNDTATTHLGPVAQDFHAAFNVGSDDKYIATVDADGVALAAIKGLNQKLEDQLREKDVKIFALEERLAKLEALLLNLNHQK